MPIMPDAQVIRDERFLTSAAILKENWDRKHDFIDNFVPFIAQLMAERHYEEVALDDLQADFTERFRRLDTAGNAPDHTQPRESPRYRQERRKSLSVCSQSVSGGRLSRD